jgi:hypothetical protein
VSTSTESRVRNAIADRPTAVKMPRVDVVASRGEPAFYDMFFGAGEGLWGFKTHLGFCPHYLRRARRRT